MKVRLKSMHGCICFNLTFYVILRFNQCTLKETRCCAMGGENVLEKTYMGGHGHAY